MTSLLPNAFGGIIDRPYLFGKCFGLLFESIYNSIDIKVASVLIGICDLMGIKKDI
jgi:hypothetical protein